MKEPSTGKRFGRDVVERVAATYAEALVGLMIADATNFQDASHLLKGGRTAALAALPAALSLVKSLLAKNVSNGDSASLASGV